MAAITQATTANQADEGKKVFVGNLTFGTTEEGLKEIFAGSGQITEAQIILRGTRSLGYGFVTFATEQDAAQAISSFDKKEVGGRTINVELAKPPSSTPRGHVAQEAAAAAAGINGEQAAADGDEARTRTKKPRSRVRNPKRGARTAPADGEADGITEGMADVKLTNGTPAPVPAAAASGPEGEAGSGAPAKRGRGRGSRGRGAPRAEGAPSTRRGPPTGEPSKTLLFVANLPFALDNDGLKALFDGYKVVSAHVVVRKYGPVTGRSKGFGFVEVADEAEQKKVLENFHGKEIDGREIQVKVAIESQREPEEAAAAIADAPAASA